MRQTLFLLAISYRSPALPLAACNEPSNNPPRRTRLLDYAEPCPRRRVRGSRRSCRVGHIWPAGAKADRPPLAWPVNAFAADWTIHARSYVLPMRRSGPENQRAAGSRIRQRHRAWRKKLFMKARRRVTRRETASRLAARRRRRRRRRPRACLSKNLIRLFGIVLVADDFYSPHRAIV